MKYQVTASRKRPKNFQSMVGQEFVATAISHSLEHQALANAYLFTGPRGVGKTSSARILAACLNCLATDRPTITPCGICSNCIEIAQGSNIDVMEIDGASNTGVGDVRDIKDEITFPPSSSRFKIYIIDEVHMLSTGAFNALLKTIEEPPAYVKFIFATTENHKIPATIKSRCQQFNFRLISIDLIKQQLESALKEIHVEYEDDALFWLAKAAKGSMRDAYTLLDQAVAISQGRVTLAQLKDKMGFAGIDDLSTLIQYALQQQMDQAITLLHDFFAKGVSAEQLIQDLSSYFHALLLLKHGITKESLIGSPITSFSTHIVEQLSLFQIKELLSSLFQLYKSSKLSLNLQLELEFFLVQLSSIHLKLDPQELIHQIESFKLALLSENNESDAGIHTPKPAETEPITGKAQATTTQDIDNNKLLDYIQSECDIYIEAKDISISPPSCQIHVQKRDIYTSIMNNKHIIEDFLQKYYPDVAWQLIIIYDKIALINKVFNGDNHNESS